MFTVHFETLGCKLNQIESEALARTFTDEGFSVDLEAMTAAKSAQSDTILSIINTCTVTSKAEQKARRLMRLLLAKFPTAAVVATGCYAELDARQIENIDERIAVIRGSRKDILAELPKKLKSYLSDKNPSAKEVADFVKSLSLNKQEIQKTESDEKKAIAPQFLLYTDTFQTHSRSSIKIQDGCANACTYCRIHLARGKSVSLDVKTVLERVRQLETAGQKEVVFTGVNLSQYRGEWEGHREDFAGLLRILLENTRDIAFRISSFYPEHITEKLCEVLKSPRVRPSFHLSIQSGSDTILKAMKRQYKAEDVYNAVRLLRETKENPFIACDIIAGFPGETDEDFSQTQKMCNDLHFAWIHAFPFSPRPDTPAYTMTPKIPERIKGERVLWLTQAAQQEKIAYINSLKGKTVTAIVENSRADRLLLKKVPIIHAVTENFLHAQINLPDLPEAKQIKAGDLIKIVIKEPLIDKILHNNDSDVQAELIL